MDGVEYPRVHEVPLLLRALDPRWRLLLAAAIYTGLQKGELLALRKSNMDLPRQVLTVARSHERSATKGGYQDGIPISLQAVNKGLEISSSSRPGFAGGPR